MLAAIVLLHLVAGWALLRSPWLREARAEQAPLMVAIVSAEQRSLPALPEPLLVPRAAPLPVLQAVALPTIEWTGAPTAEPAPSKSPAAPDEAVAAAPLAPLPAPAAPPPERQVAITQVEYLSPPMLTYPLAARRSRAQGLVQVRVRVDEQGRPERWVIARSSGHALLDDAALATVRATRFKPYTENGTPLPFWVVMPLLFELDA